MTTPSRDELELYAMGEHEDPEAIDTAIAGDEDAWAFVASEARFETLLRAAAASAVVCPNCSDLVNAERCDACGAALYPGGYTVERVLVSTGHGRMYVARDSEGRQVALKELAFVQSPTLSAITAFEREVKLLRALQHPAIPRFVASFEEGAGVHVRYYLAQELVSGEPLDARLRDHWFTEPEIIDIARRVLGVLVYLQRLSPMVIHRDIKPANLLVREDGSIAVVDFGAAHIQGGTGGSTSIGTFGYMPIEQLAGIVDATTDPYALGASLIHLLTRREPWRIFQGNAFEHINVSRALAAFLGKLVAAEPQDRFPNAAAALAALEQVANGERAEAAFTPVQKQSGRQWRALVVAAASLALAAGVGAGAYALFAEPRGETGAPQPSRGSSAESPSSPPPSLAPSPTTGPDKTVPHGPSVEQHSKPAPLPSGSGGSASRVGMAAPVPVSSLPTVPKSSSEELAESDLGFSRLEPDGAAQVEIAKVAELRIATLAPESSPWMPGLDKASAEIKERTSGRVKIRYSVGGQLGDERDFVQKIREGKLEGAIVTSIGLSLIEESIRVLELPAMFTSIEEVDYVADRMWPHFQSKFEKKGFKLADRGEVGWIYFLSKTKVETLDDLRAHRIWRWLDDELVGTTFGKLTLKSVRLGVPEVDSSLTSGLITAVYASPIVALSLQWHTKVKYITSMPMSYGIGATVVSMNALKKLSPEDLKTVERITNHHAKKLRQVIREENRRAMATLQSNGIAVVPTPIGTIDEFAKHAAKVQQDLAGNIYSRAELDEVLKYRDEFRAKQRAK